MQITDYINIKNKRIWDELKYSYQIDLQYAPKEKSWRIENDETKAIIFTPTKKKEIHSFTHELLHLYLDFKGMSTAKDILHSIYGDKSFKVLTTNGLFAIIHNFLCHKKMFPFFIEMGFDEKEFVSKRAKLSFLEFYSIKGFLLSKNPEGLTSFIGNTIALLCNDGKSFKEYNDKKLNKLKSLCPELFQINYELVDKWENQKSYDLIPLFRDFNNSLENWIEKNKLL